MRPDFLVLQLVVCAHWRVFRFEENYNMTTFVEIKCTGDQKNVKLARIIQIMLIDPSLYSVKLNDQRNFEYTNQLTFPPWITTVLGESLSARRKWQEKELPLANQIDEKKSNYSRGCVTRVLLQEPSALKEQVSIQQVWFERGVRYPNWDQKGLYAWWNYMKLRERTGAQKFAEGRGQEHRNLPREEESQSLKFSMICLFIYPNEDLELKKKSYDLEAIAINIGSINQGVK